MTDPALELQAAIVAALKDLNTAAGNGVYDMPPVDQNGTITASYPYITIGSGNLVPIDEECFDRSEFSHQIDVWSDSQGYVEVKTIAGQIRMRLHEQDLTIDGHIVDRMRVDNIVFSRDGGVISRARITLITETQPIL